MKKEHIFYAFMFGIIIGLLLAIILGIFVLIECPLNFNSWEDCDWEYCEDCAHNYTFFKENKDYCLNPFNKTDR